VATYGQIALIAGYPRHARLVGYALHHTPDRLDIPWHRVINARGEISFPKGSSHYEMQLNRLLEEGVEFVRDRVDLDRYGWRSNTRSRGKARSAVTQVRRRAPAHRFRLVTKK